MQQAALSLTPVVSPFPVYRLGILVIGLFFYSSSVSFSQPALPKFEPFRPVNIPQSFTESRRQLLFPRQVNPILSNDPYTEQNYRAIQQAGGNVPGQPNNTRQQQLEEIRKLDQEDAKEHRNWASGIYQTKLQQFLQLNPENFSITKAVYLTESAYAPNMPSFEVFEAGIKKYAEHVRQILKSEGLSEKNNTAIMHGIQKLYTQQNVFYDAKTKQYLQIPPLRYDLDDFMGDKDWTKMFVEKLLRTKTGQCHSLPLLFLCITEQLNAKAYLSLSPNHSFIQYFDEKGNRYNFETTNGNLVSQAWLAKSTYVTAPALKNRTYLDTLSSRELYAQCLSDLLLGYLMKLGYDNVSDQITKQVLAIHSTNITALMTQARLQQFIFDEELHAAGNPPQNTYPNYPKLYNAYKAMQEAWQKVEQTGFQQMPKEAYQQWLKSVELEKQKEQNRLEREKMQREINRLKKLKSTFTNSPKG